MLAVNFAMVENSSQNHRLDNLHTQEHFIKARHSESLTCILFPSKINLLGNPWGPYSTQWVCIYTRGVRIGKLLFMYFIYNLRQLLGTSQLFSRDALEPLSYVVEHVCNSHAFLQHQHNLSEIGAQILQQYFKSSRPPRATASYGAACLRLLQAFVARRECQSSLTRGDRVASVDCEYSIIFNIQYMSCDRARKKIT